MLAHVLPTVGLSGETSMTRRAYSRALKSNTKVRAGLVLKFSENDIFGIFKGQNVDSEKSNHSFESAIVFLPPLCYFNADCAYQTSNLWI